MMENLTRRFYGLLITIIAVMLAAACTINAYSHSHGYEGCDLEKTLGLGDSFAFPNFPPRKSGPPCHEFAYGIAQPYPNPRAPEECNWVFEAEEGAECVLEFRAKSFERGDIDCRQQYFTIGDEYKGARICGFNRPPKRVRTSGRQLLLTHYQANTPPNPNCRTVSSYIGGVVRCVKAKSSAPKTQAPASSNGGDVTCGPLLRPFNFTGLGGLLSVPSGSIAAVTGSFGGGTPFDVNVTCMHPTCQMGASTTISIQNVTVKEQKPAEPHYNDYYDYDGDGDGGGGTGSAGPRTVNCNFTQFPPPATSECSTLTVPCKMTGECTGASTLMIGVASGAFQAHDIQCHGTNAQLCYEIILVCSDPA